MSALGELNPTLLDYAINLGPDNKPIQRLIELLTLEDGILEDLVMLEANDITGHVSLQRTGIPTPTFRKFYEFVAPSKTTEVQVRDSIAMLENWLEVDKKLYDLQGDGAMFMMSRAKGIAEGFRIAVAAGLFYSNDTLTPEKFLGLAPRFNALSGAASSDNVITGGGSTNVTSVWLCNWGMDSVHGIYPRGSKSVGLTIDDKGQQTSQSSTSLMDVMRTKFSWDIGLSVPDWRHIVRIPNIDVTALTADASSGADVIDLMVQALERCYALGPRAAFYCNRTIRSFLRRQISNKANVWLAWDEVAGKKVMTFGGVPVRRCDSLLNTETAVA